MIYIIDTANLEAIERINKYYPIAGVTTNPSIIAKEKTDFLPLIKGIRKIIGDDKMLHIQVTAKTADEIVEEALLLKEAVGGNFYAKIPISAEGLRATYLLHNQGIKVTETAIFTQQQALMAALAGADFVAPYANRLDNIVSDGVHVVGDIVKIFNNYKLDCKVLAASFKNLEQIHECSLKGCHAVTISPSLFDHLTYHPMTDLAIEGFEKDWESIYGGKSISELLK